MIDVQDHIKQLTGEVDALQKQITVLSSSMHIKQAKLRKLQKLVKKHTEELDQALNGQSEAQNQ